MSVSSFSGFAWPAGALDAPSASQSAVSLSPSSLSSVATSVVMSAHPTSTSGSGAPPVSFSVDLPRVNTTFGSGMPSSSFATVYIPSGTSAPAMSIPIDLQSSASIQPIVLDPVSQPGVPVNGSGARTVRITVTSTFIVPSDVPTMAALAKALEQPDTIPTVARPAAADVTGVKFELYKEPEAVQTKSSGESSSSKAIIFGITGAAVGVMLLALIYFITR